MLLLPKHLIPAFDHTMSRATAEGERVHTNVGRHEKATAAFSERDKLFFLDDAAMLVAAMARSRDLKELHDPITPTSGEFDLAGTLRLLASEVTVDGNRAARRTLSSNDDYTERGAPPTTNHPAYTFEAAELRTLTGDQSDPANVNPSESEALVVRAPLRTNATGEANLSGTTLTLTLGGPWEERHVSTIADLEGYSGDTGTARVLSVSSNDATVDTALPDGDYDVDFYAHACSRLPERFEGPVVELAAALAFATKADTDGMETALANYQDEIDDNVMPFFDLKDQ